MSEDSQASVVPGAVADILSSPSWLATLCLCYLRHIASALNAMPTRPSRVPSSDGADPPSVLLMWFFNKGSRVEKAFTAAHQACDTIGAGRAWEYVAAKILERFDEHEMRKKVAHGAHDCFEDLAKLAYEVATLVKGPPHDALSDVRRKMVRFPLLLLSAPS